MSVDDTLMCSFKKIKPADKIKKFTTGPGPANIKKNTTNGNGPYNKKFMSNKMGR
jgi:hypothetical protein